MEMSEEALLAKVENGVLAGDGGYLFATLDPEYLRIVAGVKAVHAQPLANFAENMRSRAEKARAWDVTWAHVIIPDKPSTLPEEFPSSRLTPVGAQFVAAAGGSHDLIYPLEAMRRGRDERRFYNKVESHPEHAANVGVVKELVARTGLSISDEVWDELWSSSRLHMTIGDLGQLVSAEPVEAEDVHAAWSFKCFDNGLSNMWDGATQLYVNPDAVIQKRIVVFGDSCMAAIGLLCSRLFRETLFCRTLFLHDEIVQGARPDVVWTGHSDRYSWFCSDRERPLYLTMAGRCGAPCPSDRQAFWYLLDAFLMTSFEAHRFPYQLARALEAEPLG